MQKTRQADGILYLLYAPVFRSLSLSVFQSHSLTTKSFYGILILPNERPIFLTARARVITNPLKTAITGGPPHFLVGGRSTRLTRKPVILEFQNASKYSITNKMFIKKTLKHSIINTV